MMKNKSLSSNQNIIGNASRFTSSTLKIVPVSQLIADLTLSGNDDSIKSTREQVLRWVVEKSGSLPEAALNHEDFEIHDPGRRIAGVRLKTTDVDYWVLRHEDIDNKVARVWTTEVTVASYRDYAKFAVRLVLATREEHPNFEPSVPKLVRYVVDGPGLERNGRAISTRPNIIQSEEDIGELVELIERADRVRPIFVIALPDGSNNLHDAKINPITLARRCVGLARVFVLPGPLSFKFRDIVGRKDFSVYNGAIRTYRPGCDLFADNPFDHPLALPQRISDWENDHGFPFIATLLREATQYKSEYATGSEELPTFGLVRRAALSFERNRLEERESEAVKPEQLRLANIQIQQLENDVESSMQLAAGEEKARRDAEEKLRNLGSENDHLRHRIRTLENENGERRVAQGNDAIELPKTLNQLKTWADKKLAGRILVTPKAARAAKDSPFENVELAYKAVVLLANEYYQMKVHGGEEARKNFGSKLNELGLENTKTGEVSRLREKGREFIVEHMGQQRVLKRHLKLKGNSRDPARCFRLYFFWDDESQQVVIGSMPGHLETRAS